MLKLDLQDVLANVRRSDTEDLIDRVTAYRAGMEPAALALIEDELHRRGVRPEEIEEHELRCGRDCLFDEQGVALMCTFCRRPAVAQRWALHPVLRLLPLWPRRMHYCPDHLPPHLKKAAEEA